MARSLERTGAQMAPRCAGPVFDALFSVFCFGTLLGCAVPGEPQPRRPIVPAAVTDLAAHQLGDAVVLTFTLPKNTVERRPLAEPPAVEIYRSLLPGGAETGTARVPSRLVYTIPSALVETYVTDGRVRFEDPLKPEELAQSAGREVVYMVRTRASKRRASADSTAVGVRVYPAPTPIGDVKATVTQSAIELAWTPPLRASGGAPLPSLAGYRVYRAEVEPGAEAQAAQDPSHAKLKTPLELLGPTSSAELHDTHFEFGHSYLYIVRSVAQYGAEEVESADSPPLVVTPRDTFPPAAPTGLVAIVMPETAGGPAYVELSWDISPEADLAGYHVYRSEQAEAQGNRLTPELLLTPTFRDISVALGRRYFYRVTALDRAGNESPPGPAVPAEVPPAPARQL